MSFRFFRSSLRRVSTLSSDCQDKQLHDWRFVDAHSTYSSVPLTCELRLGGEGSEPGSASSCSWHWPADVWAFIHFLRKRVIIHLGGHGFHIQCIMLEYLIHSVCQKQVKPQWVKAADRSSADTFSHAVHKPLCCLCFDYLETAEHEEKSFFIDTNDYLMNVFLSPVDPITYDVSDRC